MRNILAVILHVIISSTFSAHAFAQPNQGVLVPLPSIDDFSKGNDGWALGLGLGIEYESAYEGADEFGIEADPAGALQWRKGNDVFYWAGEALGWRGLRDKLWLF
ncbi:MAG TPA: MipA/OmpV family protein, partial [Pseudomonadales bacterium]|nr:MipA/OmpV family protein [Pseudomonadales bacterium]